VSDILFTQPPFPPFVQFVRGYILTALELSEESPAYIQMLSPEAKLKIEDWCKTFYEKCVLKNLSETASEHLFKGREYEAGVDFYLTQNGHGAGFWDGDWEPWGKQLTEMCKEFPEAVLYKGDDGKLYF
jgi:hypothetical protein